MLKLYQPADGYCYNSDTLFLYDFITQFAPRGRVLEVGGGCGVLGLLVKRDFPEIELTIVEKQPEMVQFIRKNLEENRLEAEVVEGDFLEVELEGRFDIVISNPPFYPSSLKSSNRNIAIARYQEYLPIGPFFERVNQLLKERGEFLFCYDARQLDQIFKLLPPPLKIVDLRFFHPRLGKRSRLVLVRAKRHSKTPITIHPPLIGFVGDHYSPEAAAIYRRANTKSLKVPIERAKKGEFSPTQSPESFSKKGNGNF